MTTRQRIEHKIGNQMRRQIALHHGLQGAIQKGKFSRQAERIVGRSRQR